MPRFLAWSAILLCAFEPMSIKVKVVNSLNSPVPGASVIIFDAATEGAIAMGKTNEVGEYTATISENIRGVWVQANYIDCEIDLRGEYRGSPIADIPITIESTDSYLFSSESCVVLWPRGCDLPLVLPCSQCCVSCEAVPLRHCDCFSAGSVPNLHGTRVAARRAEPILDALKFIPYGAPADRVLR